MKTFLFVAHTFTPTYIIYVTIDFCMKSTKKCRIRKHSRSTSLYYLVKPQNDKSYYRLVFRNKWNLFNIGKWINKIMWLLLLSFLVKNLLLSYWIDAYYGRNFHRKDWKNTPESARIKILLCPHKFVYNLLKKNPNQRRTQYQNHSNEAEDSSEAFCIRGVNSSRSPGPRAGIGHLGTFCDFVDTRGRSQRAQNRWKD